MRPSEVDMYTKTNNRDISLRLLSILKIISLFNEKSANPLCIEDAINILPLPNTLCLDIAEEHEYQLCLYFDKFIEPHIVCKYANEY